MKKLLALTLAAAIFSCNNDTETKELSHRPDTSQVMFLTISPDGKTIIKAEGTMIVVDTVGIVSKDSVTWKKERTRDSIFSFPYYPSWLDTATKKVFPDSGAGRTKIAATWNAPKQLVKSISIYTQEDIQYLQKYLVKPDTLNKK